MLDKEDFIKIGKEVIPNIYDDGYNYNNDLNYNLVRLSSTYNEINIKLNGEIKTSDLVNHEVKERNI